MYAIPVHVYDYITEINLHTENMQFYSVCLNETNASTECTDVANDLSFTLAPSLIIRGSLSSLYRHCKDPNNIVVAVLV